MTLQRLDQKGEPSFAQTQRGRSWRAGIHLSNDYALITRGLFGIVRPLLRELDRCLCRRISDGSNLVALAGWAAVLAEATSTCAWSKNPPSCHPRRRLLRLRRKSSRVRSSRGRLVLPMRSPTASRAVPRQSLQCVHKPATTTSSQPMLDGLRAALPLPR
jgi:hypothetical protein